jgi:hypothetical protein
MCDSLFDAEDFCEGGCMHPDTKPGDPVYATPEAQLMAENPEAAKGILVGGIGMMTAIAAAPFIATAGVTSIAVGAGTKLATTLTVGGLSASEVVVGSAITGIVAGSIANDVIKIDNQKNNKQKDNNDKSDNESDDESDEESDEEDDINFTIYGETHRYHLDVDRAKQVILDKVTDKNNMIVLERGLDNCYAYQIGIHEAWAFILNEQLNITQRMNLEERNIDIVNRIKNVNMAAGKKYKNIYIFFGDAHVNGLCREIKTKFPKLSSNIEVFRTLSD